MGACPYPRRDDPRQRAVRRGAAAEEFALAAVPRGGGGAGPRYSAAQQGLPLQPRICSRGHRPLRSRGARAHGRRGRLHQRRLRILLTCLPDPAERFRNRDPALTAWSIHVILKDAMTEAASLPPYTDY